MNQDSMISAASQVDVDLSDTVYTESTNLNTHVYICDLRYKALESRIDRLEKLIHEMALRSVNDTLLIIRIWITFGICVALVVSGIYFNII